jgi:hypothetical protein
MVHIQDIVGKALKDRAFCAALIADPEKTLKAQGITPTREMIDALKALDENAVQKLAAAFSKEQAAI